jgi:hypothetical protein
VLNIANVNVYTEIKIVAIKHVTICVFRSEICRVRPNIRASNKGRLPLPFGVHRDENVVQFIKSNRSDINISEKQA